MRHTEKHGSILWIDKSMERIYIIVDMRKKETKAEIDIDSQVAAMASDKAIRMELEKINEEFAVTEMDGLEKL
jgi:hypothetical protein